MFRRFGVCKNWTVIGLFLVLSTVLGGKTEAVAQVLLWPPPPCVTDATKGEYSCQFLETHTTVDRSSNTFRYSNTLHARPTREQERSGRGPESSVSRQRPSR